MRAWLVAAVAAALAGCAAKEEHVLRQDDTGVCILTTRTAYALWATAEAKRRGIDCTPVQAAEEMQQRRTAEGLRALGEGLQSMQPQQPAPAYIPPRSINCTSNRVGGTVFTNCN